MIRAVFKNAAIYSAGLIVGKLFSVAVFILLARALGPTDFGRFAFLLALLQIVTFFADFGLGQSYMTKKHDHEPRAFSDMIVARGATLVISLAFAWILAKTASFSPSASLALILTVIPESFLTITEYYYLHTQNTLRITLRLVCRVFVLFIVFLIFQDRLTFEVTAWFNLLGTTITAILFVPWHLIRQVTTKSVHTIWTTLRQSLAYAMLSITSFAYSRGDSLLIGYLLNPYSLGIYSAAYRYLESVSILPASVNKLLFPQSAQLKVSWSTVINIMLITGSIGVLVAAAVFILSDFLVLTLVGPEFSAAVPILRIFSGVTFLFFLNQPLAALVQSTPTVKKFLPWGIANTILNIVLNVSLLPVYGVQAAAWVMLVTEFTGLLINFWFVKKIYA